MATFLKKEANGKLRYVSRGRAYKRGDIKAKIFSSLGVALFKGLQGLCDTLPHHLCNSDDLEHGKAGAVKNHYEATEKVGKPIANPAPNANFAPKANSAPKVCG